MGRPLTGRAQATRATSVGLPVVLVLLNGCESPTQAIATTCPGQTVTTADASCTSDVECPSGTECSASAGVTTGACQGSDGGACRCAPAYFPDVPSDTLISAFDVDEFELQVSTGAAATMYGWTAPQNASSVVCGLFVAAPEVSLGATPRIDNAFKSLYRSHVFRVPALGSGMLYTTQFSVDDLTSPPSSACPAAADRLNDFEGSAAAYPIVSTLQIGCWAYSDDGIVAATRLRNLGLTDLPETQPPVADCSALPAGTPDGRLCLLGPLVGGCVDQACSADAGLASFDPGDAGGSPTTPAASTTPVASCADASDMTLCQLTPDFQFGHCVGSLCADQHVSQPDLPLVTADCAQPATALGTNWLNCFDDEVQGYGTCYAGSCHLRCVSDSDCSQVQGFLGELDAGTALRCGKRDATGQLTCGAPGVSFLGICVPGGSSCP